MNKVNKLVISAACVALAFLASKIKLFELPLGGSVTLMSMLIITLPAYFYGLKFGIFSTICFSLLKFIFAGNIYHPVQALLDYGFAYVCFFVAGFDSIRKNKNGLTIGYVLGCLLRVIFSAMSGYIFFKEYTPEAWNPIIYVFVYNGAYIFAEMVISIIIINIPFVKQNLKKLLT